MNCNKKIKKRGKNFTHFLNFDEKPNKELHNLFDFSSPTEKSYTECQEKPTTVRATYTKDFNLICIHNLVRSKFIHDQKDIPRIEEKIESNNRLLQNSKLSPLERNIIIKEKQDLCQKYEEIMTLKEWNKYVDLSVPILSNYLKVMSNETKGIFIIGRDDDEDEKTLELRFYYIESYLEVISSLHILNLEVSRRINDVLTCICGNSLENVEINCEGMYVCECGYTTSSLYSTQEYKDPNKISSSSVNESLVAFQKWLNRYEGISNDFIDPQMFVEFDQWCIQNGYPTGNEVRTGNYSDYFNPSLNVLILIMSKTKHSKCFAFKNIIRNLYWGWNLPSLTPSIRNKILNDFVITQNVYEEIKTRKASLNLELRGYLHLKSVDYECFLCDFKIPVNKEAIRYTNSCWEVMCERTGVKFTKIVN